MLVGEAWGEHEEREGRPFVGPSGAELNRLLHEAGILRSECFVTNLVNRRPPDNNLGAWIAFKKKDITKAHVPLRDKMVLPVVAEGYTALLREIAAVQPNLIIAFGNAAMWALTGKWGILKWRGSHLQQDPYDHKVYQLKGSQMTPAMISALAASMRESEARPKVIPTIHPAAVLREWSQRAAVLSDLKRARREMTSRGYRPPAWNFILRPSFGKVMEIFSELSTQLARGELWFDFDIETLGGHIECFSISWSRLDAICIPLMSFDGGEGYWSVEEEAALIWAFYKLSTHPNARIRWQNGLYDAQYTYRHWHFIPRGGQDTMISQHAIFSDLPKALSFQASLYADWYVYWKDEGKNVDRKLNPEQRWNYNCLDCVYTREVGEVETATAAAMGLLSPHTFQQQMFWPVLQAMNRGVKVIESNAAILREEIVEQIELRESFISGALGQHININSSKQLQALFYEDLNQPAIFTRAKKGVPAHATCDDEALQKIGAREPLLRPITNSIADIRTLGKFLGDFVLAKRDLDGRMRCSFNIGGSESGKSAPKTYRLSSSKNAFGSGANLQTIPSEKSKSVGKWEQRQHFSMIGDPYALPNLRAMYGPDPGFTFFDMDLDRADLQVVVWETDDALLKTALRLGADIHLLNAFVLDSKEPPPLEELVESHPRYPDHRGPRKHQREFSKVFCHATNYVGAPRTIAAALGRSVHEVDRAQRIWFGAHPGIKRWHDRTQLQINKHRFVENRFGYRWYIFDRIDTILPEAVAWLPQSTVSITINKIWHRIFTEAPEIQVLLQVHDSLAGQFPTRLAAACRAKLLELSKIVIPYEDPLIIPTGLSTSEISWGDCA